MIEKKQLTIRLPVSLFEHLNEKAKNEEKSINDIMIEITEDHLKRQHTEKILKEIVNVRKKIKDTYGQHPDSTEDLVKLREGKRNYE